MPIDTVEFKGKKYLKLQTTGNAAKYIMPFALELCKGDVIYDVGYGQDDWMFPGAIGVDLKDGSEFDALNLPPLQADAIFSSHLLEHIPSMVDALDHWYKKLKKDGVLFLYLPNMTTQLYWRLWSNRKHVSYTNPEIMRYYFEDNADMWDDVFISERDLYDSFCVVAKKK